MNIRVLKQTGLLVLVALVSMSAGMAIMWGIHKVSAAEAGEHEHELVAHVGTAATCETTGLRDYWECPDCHLYFSDPKGIAGSEITSDELGTWRILPKTNHKTFYHQYKNATCAEDGNIAYYACYSCGKEFTDKACTHEVAHDKVIIKKKNHTANKIAVTYKAPSCEEDGHYAHYKCRDCDQIFNEYGIACNYQDVVIVGGHHSDAEHYEDFEAATCEHEGHYAHYTCIDCDKCFEDVDCTKLIENVTIAKKDHWAEPNTHIHERQATCTEDGTPEYWICVRGCEQKFIDQKCTELLDESVFDNYKKTNHHDGEGWQFVYDPAYRINDTAPYRYINNENKVVTVNNQYPETCIYCHAHRGNQPIPSFAKLNSNNFNNNNVEVSYLTVGEEHIIDYEVFTIHTSTLINNENGYSATIVIEVPADYSEFSNYQQTQEGVVVDMSNVVYSKSGKKMMNLNVHFDTLPENETSLIWEFDWDGDGINEQKIKVVVTTNI